MLPRKEPLSIPFSSDCDRLLFCFCSYRSDAEGFRAIAEQNQSVGSDACQLVIFFGRKKNDIVFFQYPFVALDILDGAFPGNYEESLRRLVVMHRRAVARRKVQHPRAKIVGAEELDISETFLSRFFDLLIEVGELHGFLRPVRVCARLLESEGGVNLCVESEAR